MSRKPPPPPRKLLVKKKKKSVPKKKGFSFGKMFSKIQSGIEKGVNEIGKNTGMMDGRQKFAFKKVSVSRAARNASGQQIATNVRTSKPSRKGGMIKGGKVLHNQILEFKAGQYKGSILQVKISESEEEERFLSKPHGNGKFFYKDGGIYIGKFVENKKEGVGKMKYKNGNYYDGEWKKGFPHGFGKYYTKKSDLTYEGFLEKGKYHGIGKITNSEAVVVYDGMWVQGTQEGIGKSVDPQGNCYHGNFKNNKKEGKGIITYISGAKYSGNFKNDKENGLGVMLYKDGSEFVGWFKNGEREKDYLQIILEKLGLVKFLPKCKNQGFSLSMMKTMSKEDFEMTLEIIFPNEKDRKKVKFALEKENKNIMKLLEEF